MRCGAIALQNLLRLDRAFLAGPTVPGNIASAFSATLTPAPDCFTSRLSLRMSGIASHYCLTSPAIASQAPLMLFHKIDAQLRPLLSQRIDFGRFTGMDAIANDIRIAQDVFLAKTVEAGEPPPVRRHRRRQIRSQIEHAPQVQPRLNRESRIHQRRM